MLGSIRMGVKATLSASYLMVFLGDQPGISFKLIPQCFFQKVLSSYEGKGLRGLFREHASSVLRISVNDPILLADTDTPLDYQRCYERSLETHKKGEA